MTTVLGAPYSMASPCMRTCSSHKTTGVPISGGKIEVLISGHSPYGIALDASNVFWTTYEAAGAVLRMPK